MGNESGIRVWTLICVSPLLSLLVWATELPLGLNLSGKIVSSPGLTAPQLGASSVLFTLPFNQALERAYWDFPLRVTEEATTLRLTFETQDPILLAGLTVHCLKGGDWGTVQPLIYPHGTGKYVAICPQGAFLDERNKPFEWKRAQVLRLSFWRGGLKERKEVKWIKAEFVSDPVAILLADDAMAAGGLFLAKQCVERLQVTLFRMGLGSAVILPPAITPSALKRFSVLIVPYAPQMKETQVRVLKTYVNTGGKVIVFYPSAQGLADLLQVKPLPYRAADRDASWVEMCVENSKVLVPSPTINLLSAQPSSAAGEVFAYWRDNRGFVDRSLPAVVVTPAGAWFAYLPPLPSVAAVNLFEALFNKVLPGLRPMERSFGEASGVVIPRGDPPRRGVWFHHPESRHEKGWEGVLDELTKVGVSDVFVQLQAAGTVFVPIKGRDVVSGKVPRRAEDGLHVLLAAASKHKIRVHAWITCWSLEGSDPSQQAVLKSSQRLMADSNGALLNWLCPSLPENRALLLDGIKALAFRGVQGIHLDYVRYPEAQGCYALATRKAFETVLGRRVATWPQDVLSGGSDGVAFDRFRQQEITSFVQEVRQVLQKSYKGCELSAAVFPTPDAARLRGQNWSRWVNESLVDFVCPMMYSNTGYGFEQMLKSGLVEIQERARVWPGIGYSADESQLDRRSIAEQLEKVRQAHVGGVVFFAYDSGLAEILN
ncbi:MAG: family 10 glycosylhydrolase [bacterium]